MEKELFEVPLQARICYEKNKGLILPVKVPYIGMGSSYYAALVLRYLGVNIFPEMAGEYGHYLKNIQSFDHAVLISQSGKTTDVLTCSENFGSFTAIVNDMDSPLVRRPNLKNTILLFADVERYPSTKTFINSLIVLYLGHGFDVKSALDSMERRFSEFELVGEFIGEKFLKRIKNERVKCIPILGNGPNYGIACQAALMLSETTKFPFIGMSLAQYEHGYKETAENSMVIILNPLKGILFERVQKLSVLLRNSGAEVFEINEHEMNESLSPIPSLIPLFFMARYLARKLKVTESFVIGNKITEYTSDITLFEENQKELKFL